MKNIYKILVFSFLVISIQANSQIGIGKEVLTNESVLLEFGNDAKGILLPSVTSADGASPGTFIFNTTTKSVQVLEELSWKNLTDADQGIIHAFTNEGSDVGDGVILGAQSTSKTGVLVLESTTQVMVLPKVENPHINMKGVIAGILVYDTTADMLAVYDGANWSYWK